MQDINITQLRTEFSRYPDLPGELYDYVVNVQSRCVTEKLHPHLADATQREDVLRSLSNLFVRVREATGIPSNQVARALGFSAGDTAPGRVDAFLAELRTIVWLQDLGFSNIVPLKATREKRRADIRATFATEGFVVEVFCATEGVYRWPNHVERRHDLVQYFYGVAVSKKSQLDQAAEEFHCQNKVLAMVLDSQPARALHSRDEFLDMVVTLHADLAWVGHYHVGLVVGPGFDVIYPELPISR